MDGAVGMGGAISSQPSGRIDTAQQPQLSSHDTMVLQYQTGLSYLLGGSIERTELNEI